MARGVAARSKCRCRRRRTRSLAGPSQLRRNGMSYSSLLVHVDVDGVIGGRVRLAAGLADHFHSHLIGVASWMARPAFVVEGVVIDPEPTDEVYKEMQAVLSRRGEEFRACVGKARSRV